MIDKELLSLLACPSCKGDVEEKDGHIHCLKCGLNYPIREGVPVMLLDEARKDQQGPL